MNTTINRVLLLQLTLIYRREGLLSLLSYIIKAFNYRVINKYFRGSYSQKGEDLVIDKYFNHKKNGFYVDVGSCHPERFNNTNFFYKKGWNGINIEPNPDRIKLFQDYRKRDINLNVGIGDGLKKATFNQFELRALSTFSKKEADTLVKVGYKLQRKLQIRVETLKSVLSKYKNAKIDFMTVDTEGFDMEVLKSNDWKKIRPKLLCVETIDFIDFLTSSKKTSKRKLVIDSYLFKRGYKEYYTNGLNTIYEDEGSED